MLRIGAIWQASLGQMKLRCDLYGTCGLPCHRGLLDFPKSSKTAKIAPVNTYISLKELVAQLNGYRYLYVYKLLRLLEEEGLLHPFRGDRNEYLLTLDDSRRLRRFIQLREGERGLQIALLKFKIEEQAKEIERLKTLLPVEVKPPWWKQFFDWWRQIWSRSKVGRS